VAHRPLPRVDLRHPAIDDLAERDRRRILQVGATDHDDVVEGARLRQQCAAERLDRGQQPIHEDLYAGDVHHGGERVVRRLPHVDVIVGVDWTLGAEPRTRLLVREVGDHLVRIHVALRAGSGLEDDQRELAVHLAGNHAIGSTFDQPRAIRVELAELVIGERGRLLDNAEGTDDRARPAEAIDTNREVLARTLGLRAPEAFGGDRDVTECVMLEAGVCAHVDMRARNSARHKPLLDGRLNRRLSCAESSRQAHPAP
jgi:hypothetical protein